ncbi:putative arginase protein [Botryosphaeria dothidea]|uniref:Arginase protein n=1 Tax=Botryosphaeria dothidea TaxID=55169 RepID=A0A8H4IN20_9PEZI|nr:putative arginase protein [Botryosphaeria dothidea]
MAPATSIALILSPYHVGLPAHRVGAGPLRIQSHGLEAALRRICPATTTTTIPPVDDDDDDAFEGEIGRSFEILRRISRAVAAARAARAFPVVLSGNCNASVGVAAGLGDVDDLGVVWFDAHDDMDTPDTHVNGYFDAMGVSMLAGRSWRALMATVPGHVDRRLDGRFVYCGLRDVTEVQRRAVEDAGVDVGMLDGKKMGQALVHLDLDCLDESLGRVNEYPSPGGLLEDDLFKSLSLVPAKVTPVSLTVCSFNPNLEGGDRIARIAVEGMCRFVESLVDSGVLQRSSR